MTETLLSPTPDATHRPALYLRLTALWGLCEAGLGGLLHLFQLPLTGILVSGFAIMCVALLGYYSRFQLSVMVQAWAVVIAIKFAFSPQSPPTAYLAVTFQAFFSLFCFWIIPNFRLACIVAGMLALVESAGQRILVLTIGFGMDFWKAIDQIQLAKKGDPLMLNMMTHSQLLIFAYLLIHAVAGIWVGWLAGRLPRAIEAERVWLLTLDPPPVLVSDDIAINKKRRKFPYLVPVILAVMGLILIISGRSAGWSLVRGALLWLFYLSDFVQKYLMGWIQKLVLRISGKYSPQVEAANRALPELRICVRMAWTLAKQYERGKYQQAVRFISLVFALSLGNEIVENSTIALI